MASDTRPTSTKQLRVALLTNSLSPHTLPLCEAISAQIGELTAFVSAASDTFHNFPKPEATFRIVVQRSLNRLRLRYSQKNYSVKEQLHLPVDTLPQLFKARPDIVISSQFGARTLFAIIYRILRPRVRLVVWAALSAHTENERSGSRTFLRKCMLRFAHAAFVNGRSGEDYIRSLGFKGAFCTVPYTIDGELFRGAQYAPDEHRRLLFCGRLEPTKGILRFCQGLHRWCAQNVSRRIRFQVIGDGPDREAILSLPDLPNLTLQVLPRMERAELVAYYQDSDIFVFPSRFDEWGVVVNEAMSAGLPVLGSLYSQAVVELIQDGVTGWVFDCEDDSDLQAQLNEALSTSTSQLSNMSAHARRAIEAISPEIVAGRVLQTLADVCNLPSTNHKADASPSLPSPTTATSAS